ncbi:MAG: crossover junction endodeoxyribonuclease RuvC [Planctomycetota bacterium]
MTGHKAKRKPARPSNPDKSGETRKSKIRFLGIDPGTRRVGWGVVAREKDGTLKLVNCGCIAPSPKLALKERLRDIFAELEEVLRRARPDAAALEETFAGVNMKSAIAMGEGRGIALLCLARAGVDVLELSPRSIKHAVTGSGAASKSRVAAMVAAQLSLKEAPEPEDITDALAAAIALARRM